MAANTSPFAPLNIRRLRIWLLLFFIALMIPTTLLIHQAYGELQWEAFYQQRIQAEELSKRIDKRLGELINREEQRGYADYAFLNVAGSEQVNFLQRSPLARFPVESDIPGLLGYFQVDGDGQFTTPLLPADPQAETYGIPSDEYQQRLGLQMRLLDILDRNQLVKAIPKRMKLAAASESSAIIGPASEDDSAEFSGALRSYSQPLISKTKSADQTQGIAEITSVEPAETPADETPISTSPRVSQQAFDRLEAPLTKADNSYMKKSQLGRVADLELDKAYEERADRAREEQQKVEQQQASILFSKRQAEKKARKEITQLPETRPSIQSKASNRPATDPDVRIRIFESEIDPFELSMLDSGHLVLYRKVWRNGQRIIQGLLIEQQAFTRGIIQSAYNSTALSTVSHLLVAWQGNVISRFQAIGNRDDRPVMDELTGTLLYQTSLSQPLDKLELVFTINQLPVGPGATVINWIAAIMILITGIGLYLVYRAGVRQLQLVQQQQDFVSAVSHELKTPLTSIRMYGEMLQENWASEEKKKTYYDMIVGESQRLTRLINNVLQLARFSRNAVQTNVRDVGISELLGMAQSAVHAAVNSAGFSLRIDCEPDVSKRAIQVDTDHFVQIMINLVDNALKFSANADERVIDLACDKTSDGQIQISIRDHGPGIPKDQMKKIFTLFYRAENELTRETVGTGIGLALVSQLMREMQGAIDVHNANPGARFILSFRSAGEFNQS
jgi:signal transduction histidine kinase